MAELFAMACLALSWLLPNHYPPWTSIYNELCAALGLALIVIAHRRQWTASRLPNAAWFVFGVALIPVAQWASGLLYFSGDAWVSAAYILGFGSAIAAGSFWARAGAIDAATNLSFAVLFGALASSFLACIQAFQPDASGLWSGYAVAPSRPAANLGQPNNLATLLGLGTVSLLLLREQRRVGNALGITMLVVLIVGAALVQSRTSLLFGPVILVGLVVAKRRNVPFKTSARTVALATLLHWALVFAWPQVQEALMLGVPEALAERGLGSPRLHMWRMLLHASALSPWFGYGWLQVGAAELAAVNDLPPVGELWLQGHNLFLEFVVWCGYPLGMVLLGLCLYWYVTRASRAQTIEAVAGMLAVSIFGVHAMLELPHHYAYFLIPIGLWIGQIEFAIGSPCTIPPRWNIVPFATSLLVAIALIRDYPAVEEDFRLVRFQNLRVGAIRGARPAPNAPFLSSLTGFLNFARTEPKPGMSKEALAAMQAATERYPYAPSLARLASAWALNGRLDDATQLFLKIRQINGQTKYLELRRQLRDRILDGQSGLTPLYDALPE